MLVISSIPLTSVSLVYNVKDNSCIDWLIVHFCGWIPNVIL